MAQVVGFVAGYVLESFRVTVYAVFGGVIVASAICVPDWGIFKGEHIHSAGVQNAVRVGVQKKPSHHAHQTATHATLSASAPYWCI
jgi:hypothetical protein